MTTEKTKTSSQYRIGIDVGDTKIEGVLLDDNGIECKRIRHPQAIGRSFTMENDANCFAIAEARLGAAAQYKDVLALVLGTGVGAGIVLQGNLISSHNKIGGEWGHMALDPAGPQCYWGRKGCVERYLSGSALEKQYLDEAGLGLESPRSCY